MKRHYFAFSAVLVVAVAIGFIIAGRSGMSSEKGDKSTAASQARIERRTLSPTELSEVQAVAESYIENIRGGDLRAAYNSLHPAIKRMHAFESFERNWRVFGTSYGRIKSYEFSSYTAYTGLRPERVNLIYILETTKSPHMLPITVDKKGDVWMVDVFHGFESRG